MLLPLLLSAAKNAADTTHKIDFAQKLESFSDMSLRQMVEACHRWRDLHRDQDLHRRSGLFHRPVADPCYILPASWDE